MRKNKTDNGLTTILSSLIIILLVAFVVGFLYFRTDGLTTGVKEFYVKTGGNTFMSEENSFDIVVGKEYKFEIVNTLDNITGNESSYKLAIVPNTTDARYNFNFSADGNEQKYFDVLSLTRGFTITADENSFTFVANSELVDILKTCLYTDEINGVPTTIDTNAYYYRLVISSIGENAVNININFNLKSEK